MSTQTPPAPTPVPPRPARRPRRWRRLLLWGTGILALLAVAIWLVPLQYAHEPAASVTLNDAPAHTLPALDHWGKWYPTLDRNLPGPGEGAVAITPAVLALGRSAYHSETFGNEVFLTDVLGILEGPLNTPAFASALLSLNGAGTTNLRVPAAFTATVGGRTFQKGELVDTGIDVPRGTWLPLGLRFVKTPMAVKVGITCAACHSTVDPATGKVVHGAPNMDLRAGLLLAMGSNTAAYFAHADAEDFKAAGTDPSAVVTLADGRNLPLPDAKALEDAVDARFLKWPPGYFDSMVDFQAAPTKLPHAWAFGTHPYNYSGSFSVGPFKGLSVQTNNVHGLNSDSLTLAEQASALFGLDPEQYRAIVLRNAPAARFRYDPAAGKLPSQLLRAGDPTPEGPGINHAVALPTFPGHNPLSPTSLWNVEPGRPVWEKVNAMAAWQLTLGPPGVSADAGQVARGKAVFEKVGCATCHAGPQGTNNRVIAQAEVNTQPLRAKAMRKTEPLRTPPLGYAFDQSVPLPREARVVEVPSERIDEEQLKLAHAWGGTAGGYRVTSLVGLGWTAPYLHDGGVSVGPDAKADLGVSGTLLKGLAADPRNSLRALVDRDLRARVVAANRADPGLAAVHVEGVGHEFWADATAGVSADDQQALVEFLLAFPGK